MGPCNAMWQSLVTPAHVTLPLNSRADPCLVTNRHLRNRPACSPNLRLPLRLSHSRRVHCSASLLPCDLKSCSGTNNLVDVELKVRGYEVDQYGVVNNAVYSSYCQHAHHEVLESLDVIDDAVVRSGEALALSEMSLKFIAPLRSGDKFVDRVTVVNSSATRFHFQHHFYKLPNLEPILEAKATVVWLDRNYRPVRIPPQVRSKLAQQGDKLLKASSSSSLVNSVTS